jgi:hypothetical protein
MFWPFVVGMMFTKYNVYIPKCIDSIFGAICLFVLWAVSFVLELPSLSQWFGISAAYFASKNISWQHCGVLKYIGRISLSVYILHLLFRFPFLIAGKWFAEVALEYGWWGRIITLPVQLMLSMFLALMIIILCVTIDRLIRRVPLVRVIILGYSGSRMNASK